MDRSAEHLSALLWGGFPGATFLWQVALHSFVAAVVLYAWSRHLELPSGRPKRLLLASVLVVPLVTAALPGPETGALRDRLAWLDSARILELPVGVPAVVLDRELRLGDLALGVAAVTALVTVGQEMVPALRRLLPHGDPVPLAAGRLARSFPGWERVRVDVVDVPGFLAATTGLPGRPLLLLSPEALGHLRPDELEAVLRHEHAHWRRGRWIAVHLLFAARAIQLYNPVALWVFRHVSFEYELACDREAVAGGDPKPLIRALLAHYEAADRRDGATRRALRRRIDALRGRLPVDDGALPLASVGAAALLLLLLLPWIV